MRPISDGVSAQELGRSQPCPSSMLRAIAESPLWHVPAKVLHRQALVADEQGPWRFHEAVDLDPRFAIAFPRVEGQLVSLQRRPAGQLSTRQGLVAP
eukprot:14077359-Alexandrium_andersonii.AAC.1